MKKAFLAIALFACASTPAPLRTVKNNVLTSRELPAIRIRVAPEFRYIGSFPFRIGDVAAGERQVFAEVRNGRVVRTVIAQFEGFLPSSSEIYRYDFTNAPDWNGYRFRENNFATNEPQYSREHPGNEAALTAAFLREKGYVVPDEWMINRWVTLGDETRKHELIVFYAEDLAATGHNAAEMYSGEDATPLWTKMRGELRERARRAVEVLPRN